jgi:hypothetical protein
MVLLKQIGEHHLSYGSLCLASLCLTLCFFCSVSNQPWLADMINLPSMPQLVQYHTYHHCVLASARHRSQAWAHLSPSVLWDAPPVLLRGRNAMRCMAYAAKAVASLDMELLAFKVVLFCNPVRLNTLLSSV